MRELQQDFDRLIHKKHAQTALLLLARRHMLTARIEHLHADYMPCTDLPQIVRTSIEEMNQTLSELEQIEFIECILTGTERRCRITLKGFGFLEAFRPDWKDLVSIPKEEFVGDQYPT